MPEVGEPKVSVHGIPQSQYNQQYAPVAQANIPESLPPPPGGSGLIGNIKQHWQVWSVALGVLTIVVMIVIYRMQNRQTANPVDQSGNYTTGGSGSSGTSGLNTSSLDAEYNQLISLQNQSNATLAGILTYLQGKGSSGTGTGNGTGGGDGTGTNPTGNPSIDPGYGEYGPPQGLNMAERNWTPKSVSAALNALHWDTNEGVPIYDQPNSLGKVIKNVPFGQNITTTNFWTATGPLEYNTGTSWYQVKGGGYVPLWELMPEAVPTTQSGRQTIFPTTSSVPQTPFGNKIANSDYMYNDQYIGISGIS